MRCRIDGVYEAPRGRLYVQWLEMGVISLHEALIDSLWYMKEPALVALIISDEDSAEIYWALHTQKIRSISTLMGRG